MIRMILTILNKNCFRLPLGFGVGGLARGAARGTDGAISCGQYIESLAASTHGPSGDPAGDTSIVQMNFIFCDKH